MSDTAAPSTPVQADPASPSPVTSLNAKTARRQKLLLGSLGALALVGGSWFILGGDDGAKSDDPTAAQTIDTAGLINRDLSQREFVATYGNRLDAVTREQKAMKDASLPREEIEAQLAALKAENQAMRVDGQAAIDAISAENADLKTRLASQSTSAPPSVPPPAYGPQAGGYDARGRTAPSTLGGAPAGAGEAAMPGPGEVRLMSFTSDKAGANGPRFARPETPPVVIEDSPDYLPPNSYASARVIVGVDASAGVASQTDPLPVVLRITGPARSVMQNGKVLTTRIQGCIVNGAARGDLSSEKVYVKLARMTCDQPGGRVAVSEVKGFISFAGKSGVRGRVVSREGSLVSQALLAGIVGGLSMIGSALWGVWATDKLLALDKREVVTVQLSRIMGDFIEAEARAGRPPEETKMRVQAYLQAVEASVEHLGREGRTVLVAEAVVAGSTPDLTEAVRADVARRVGAIPDARR